ncbi:MAG: MarR family winged helix-turn-helix transcriptional regulator [Rikenellaceae bacterium]|nr:MarR family winged helix-turn-helix transcriptional regulator [Rikenellaceae bacterium]
MANTIEQPDEQLGFLLMQASLLKLRLINSALKKVDLTYIQFVILAGILELSQTEDFVTQQTISARRRLDKAMVSNVVKTLISKSLIYKETHVNDHRAFVLKITPAGEAKAEEGKRIAKSIDDIFFAGTDHDTLRRTLKQLLIQESIDGTDR